MRKVQKMVDAVDQYRPPLDWEEDDSLVNHDLEDDHSPGADAQAVEEGAILQSRPISLRDVGPSGKAPLVSPAALSFGTANYALGSPIVAGQEA